MGSTNKILLPKPMQISAMLLSSIPMAMEKLIYMWRMADIAILPKMIIASRSAIYQQWKGGFASTSLPCNMPISTGCVRVGDVQSRRKTWFICRWKKSNSWQISETPRSYILINQGNGTFKDQTQLDYRKLVYWTPFLQIWIRIKTRNCLLLANGCLFRYLPFRY